MKIALVGIGRMGSVLATILADHCELYLFDKNTTRMNLIAEELRTSVANNLKEIVKIKSIILALPDREVITCIKELNQLNEPITVMNIATNVGQHTLNSIAASHVKCISVKFIGHAGEMAYGERPVIIVNQSPKELVPIAVEVFQLIGQVIVGDADVVQKINTIAAQKAIEAAVSIERELKDNKTTDPAIIKSAIRQVAAGIMKSYADDNLGPFAKEIVHSVRTKLNRK